MTRRRTKARLNIAAELLRGQDRVQWGYELSRNAGVGAGSMYPFLSELLEKHYLEDGWEDRSEVSGRPPRRYYRLTPEGKQFLADFLSATPSGSRRVRDAVPKFAPGAVRS